jgi:hypothetical protein
MLRRIREIAAYLQHDILVGNVSVLPSWLAGRPSAGFSDAAYAWAASSRGRFSPMLHPPYRGPCRRPPRQASEKPKQMTAAAAALGRDEGARGPSSSRRQRTSRRESARAAQRPSVRCAMYAE